MFSKRPPFQIDKIEKVEINTPLHPYLEAILFDYWRANQQNASLPIPPYGQFPQHASDRESKEPAFLKLLDYVSRGVSILSGIAVIVFVVLLFSGRTAIGNVQIGTLLTVISFTLVGGLISIGGVKMFSINASLRKSKEKIERAVTAKDTCPFVSLFVGEPSELRRPGNPHFCVKCPLGIDTSSNLDDGLIHVCRVYPLLHQQWRELPGAEKVLYR